VGRGLVGCREIIARPPGLMVYKAEGLYVGPLSARGGAEALGRVVKLFKGVEAKGRERMKEWG